MNAINRILPVLLFFTSGLFKQTIAQQASYKEISGGLHYARHGSGDMDGLFATIDLKKLHGKRLVMIYSLGFSLHGQKAYPGSDDPVGALPADLQTQVPRWVTAGIQLSPMLSYKVIKQKSSGLRVSAGPVFRYQLNGYPNAYQYIRNSTSFRQPFYVIRERDDQSFNLGYAFRLSHQFKRSNRGAWSIHAFYQNDTNGDALTGFGLSYDFLFQ